MIDYELQSRAEEMLKDAGLSGNVEYESRDKRTGLVNFELGIEGCNLTFAFLEGVSKTFNTKSINVAAHYESGGCPTCGGYAYQTLEISGATVP